MKKFCLFLGLTLILVCWGGGGYYGFETCPAFGQSYFSAPYENPLSQLLYYLAPPVNQNQSYYAPSQSYQETNRAYRDRERQERERQRYQRQQTQRAHRDRDYDERQDHDKQPPGWTKGKKTGWGGAHMPPGQMKKYDR
jgi:hypothetical protein